jgi:cytochrome P450
MDPIPAVWQDDPFPLYRTLREQHPLHFVEPRALWVLSRHADVARVLRDPVSFSSARGVVPSGYVPANPTLIVMNPPRHTAMRAAVSRAFTPRRIDLLAPRIREIASELIEAMPAHGSVDAFDAFTDPLPLLVMAELLGIDAAERPMFKRCGDAIVYASDNPPELLRAAEAELTEYLSSVFAMRRREPRDDLISLLLHSSAEGAALSEQDLLGLCFLLLVAGTETTTSALGTALLLLDRYPAARARLIADPALMPGACEEMLRFDSPVHGLSRVTTHDVVLHDQIIHADSRVHLLYAAANRDPDVFDDPDRFDITRRGDQNLSFGFGVHFCLGASLARMELEIGIEAFLRHSPDYAVQRSGVERMRSDTNRGFRCLPVSL